MAAGDYDYLIIGSTPLAGLLASQLSAVHGRRVCLVGMPFSPFRLERGISLSVDIITRPDTLSLLKRATEETTRHLAGLGKGVAERVDPLFVAETPASMAAVAHFRHLAQALGFTIEQIADASIAEGTLFRVRGASTLSSSRLAGALATALMQQGVLVLDRAETTLTLRRDGSARIVAGTTEASAAQAVLADDEAILNEVPADCWDKSLEPERRIAMLVEPSRASVESFTIFPDRGVVLRSGEAGSLSAIVSGDPSSAEARLAASARKSLPLRRAGEVEFTALRTTDAVPLLGPGRGHRAIQVAGFGAWGPFFSPIIARMLAGAPGADEEAWFAARRNSQRATAVDYAAVNA